MEKISKNCYKGSRITDVNRIIQLSKERGSIYHSNWGIKPASVIINMSLGLIVNCLEMKGFYEVVNVSK